MFVWLSVVHLMHLRHVDLVTLIFDILRSYLVCGSIMCLLDLVLELRASTDRQMDGRTDGCTPATTSLGLPYIITASRYASPEIGMVAAGKAPGVKKNLVFHGWVYSRCRLCGCCRPASGRTVRGDQ